MPAADSEDAVSESGIVARDIWDKAAHLLDEEKKQPARLSRASEGIASDVRYKVPTGVGALDCLLNGGWPGGRIIELTGPWGSGKSTLMLMALRSAVAAGGWGVLIDQEGGFDRDRAVQLGLDPAQLVISEPPTMEDAFFHIDQYCERCRDEKQGLPPDRPIVICVDTLSALKTQPEVEHFKGRGKGRFQDGMMSRPRIVRGLLRQIVRSVSLAGVVVIFGTHTIKNPEGAMEIRIGEKESIEVDDSGEGGGLKLYATHRINLLVQNLLVVEATGEVVGQNVMAVDRKSKRGRPYQVVELPLYYSTGFSDDEALFRAVNRYALTEHRGSWCVVTHDGEEYKYQNERQFQSHLAKVEGLRAGLLARLQRSIQGDTDVRVQPKS